MTRPSSWSRYIIARSRRNFGNKSEGYTFLITWQIDRLFNTDIIEESSRLGMWRWGGVGGGWWLVINPKTLRAWLWKFIKIMKSPFSKRPTVTESYLTARHYFCSVNCKLSSRRTFHKDGVEFEVESTIFIYTLKLDYMLIHEQHLFHEILDCCFQKVKCCGHGGKAPLTTIGGEQATVNSSI